MDIRILDNQLAKEANSGNEEARALLLKLISQTKSLSKLKKRVDKKQVNKKRLKKGKLRGSVMSGLKGKTSSRNWKHSK